MTGLAQDDNSSISDEIKNILETDKPNHSNFSELDNLFDISNDLSVPSDNVQTDVPVDGGLGFLLVAGAGYVAHGMNRKRRKMKKDQDEETHSVTN